MIALAFPGKGCEDFCHLGLEIRVNVESSQQVSTQLFTAAATSHKRRKRENSLRHTQVL